MEKAITGAIIREMTAGNVEMQVDMWFHEYTEYLFTWGESIPFFFLKSNDNVLYAKEFAKTS